MQREQFTFYRSFLDALRDLPPKQRGAACMAIVEYALDQAEPSLSGMSMTIFRLIRPTLDSARKKASGGSARRNKTGSAFSESDEQNANRTESTSPHWDEQNGNRTQTEREQNANKKEREREKEKEREDKCPPPSPPRRGAAAPRFSPPGVEEVAAYCLERGSGVDPQAFVDFYASKGWRVGSAPMKDWRAAVRTWERREPGRAPAEENAKQTDGLKGHYETIQRRPGCTERVFVVEDGGV